MQKFLKYVFFLVIFCLLFGIGYFFCKQFILNQAIKWIEKNPLNLPITHDPVQKDSCGLGICLMIPNTSLTLLNQTVHIGDIEVGLLFQYPLTLRVRNQTNRVHENYLTGTLDVSENNIQVHEMNFLFFPLHGTFSGYLHQDTGKLSGHVQNLRTFLQQYWNDLNPNLPIEVTYFISNSDYPVELTQHNHWILFNQIPIFKIK